MRSVPARQMRLQFKHLVECVGSLYERRVGGVLLHKLLDLRGVRVAILVQEVRVLDDEWLPGHFKSPHE